MNNVKKVFFTSFTFFTLLSGCDNRKPQFETVTLRQGTLQKTVAAQGRVEALIEVDVSSKMDGRIIELLVVEGAKVRKGQTLVQLDDALAKVALEEAKAHAKDAYSNLTRAKKMRQEKAIPQAELDTAQVQHEVMQTKKQAAEIFLRDLTITSPVDGKIIHKFVEESEFAKAGAPLLTVADVSKVLVKAEIDQTDIGFIKPGQPAMITADGFGGRVFMGTVKELGQSVGIRRIQYEDPSKIQDRKVLETKIEMKDIQDLKLGMTVDIKVEIFKKEKVWAIPRRAVHMEKQQASVQVLVGEKPMKKTVTLGASDDWDVEVTKGLGPADRVILPASK